MRSLPFTVEQLWEAWERVQENAGCAGADGVTVAQFGQRAARGIPQLLARVAEDRYRPYPLLKIVVEKKPGGGATRTLLVPSVGDRILQTAVARHLSRSFEDEFSTSGMMILPHGCTDKVGYLARQVGGPRHRAYPEVP